MASFDQFTLDPDVLASLNDMGYHTMTPIQEMAIPKLLTGQDFLGQAPTGTGKTAAFAIPLISRITKGAGPIEALIIGPTRELAQQITEEINKIGKQKGIQALAVYGGENVFVQKEALRRKEARIIVGTPGRILDHIRQVTLDLTQTRLVILDEADEMLDMGFRPDIEEIFKQLPGGRETWLFSATVSPEIRKIADQYMYYPEEVCIKSPTRTAANITQYYWVTPEDEKPRALRQLLKSTPELYGIVFCQTKRDVVLLTRKLRDYFPMDCLHGGMLQSDRDAVLDKFRTGELKLLVATDIMARGIDVDNLTHVINYSPPPATESYIHRIGRTARKGESGTAITLFTPSEQYQLEQLSRRIKTPLEKHPESTAEFAEAAPGWQGGGRKRSGGGRGSSGGGFSGRGGNRGGSGGNSPHHQHGGGQDRPSGRNVVGMPVHMDRIHPPVPEMSDLAEESPMGFTPSHGLHRAGGHGEDSTGEKKKRSRPRNRRPKKPPEGTTSPSPDGGNTPS